MTFSVAVTVPVVRVWWACCLAVLPPRSSVVCSLLSFGFIPLEGAPKLLLPSAPVAGELVPSAGLSDKRLQVPLVDVFEAKEGRPGPFFPACRIEGPCTKRLKIIL